MKKLLRTCLQVLLILSLPTGFGASRAEAGTVAGVQTANGNSVNWRGFIGANQNATIGWSFSVSAVSELTALGIYDHNGDGIEDAHPVGIWNASGALLAQATIPAGTAGTLVGSYRYVTLASPLTLSAGQTYVVGAYFGPVSDICGSACGDVSLYSGAETYDPRIAFVQSRQNRASANTGSLAFPDISAGVPEGVFGPNFLLVSPVSDLSVTKTNNTTSVVSGSSTTYTMVASNAGPDAVTGATIADNFPAACTNVSYTSIAAAGATGNTAGPASGNINDAALNLPAGASVTYTAICNIDPAATGRLVNTVTISGSPDDPTPGNNSATDTDPLAPQADLSITKTDDVATATPGTTTTYTIVAANAGPSNAPLVDLVDTVPTACTDPVISCVGNTGGGSCIDAGPPTHLNLPTGATVTLTLACTISPSATGNLVNRVDISSSAINDPDPANNSATDTDRLIPLATLTIQLDAPGSAPTAFGFTTVGLTPTAFSLQHGQTRTFTNLIPGQSYVVNDQPPPPGWVLDQVLCSAPAPECVAGSITLIPTAGRTVTGTFRFLRLAEAIPVFSSVWGLGALIGLFGLVLARLRRRI